MYTGLSIRSTISREKEKMNCANLRRWKKFFFFLFLYRIKFNSKKKNRVEKKKVFVMENPKHQIYPLAKCLEMDKWMWSPEGGYFYRAIMRTANGWVGKSRQRACVGTVRGISLPEMWHVQICIPLGGLAGGGTQGTRYQKGHEERKWTLAPWWGN